MTQRKSEIRETVENRDRIHMVMTYVSLGFLILSIAIIVRIVIIQTTYSVDPKVAGLFHPREIKHVDAPVRGRILAKDGRPLAISAPLYDIHMDCTVRRDEFRRMDEKERRRIAEAVAAGKPAPEARLEGEKAEKEWRDKARELSKGLAAMFPGKSADKYYNEIINGRERGAKYLKIRANVSRDELLRLKALPLFNEGQYRGGLITYEHEERLYPYDTLARRVIGYVKDAGRIGIEGSYDYELHGREGYEWRRVTDDFRYIHDFDSVSVKKIDGNDVRTTIDIDFQNIADRALRRQIADDPQIRAGIAIIMEASTGAIRAMVNLSRDTIPGSPLWERDNLVLKEVGEQGSVMKTVSLLTLVEDGHVKTLGQTIPTNNGYVPGYNQDVHILDYQRLTGRRDITVKHGFEISSNYVFTYLAEHYYGSNPQNFFDKIYSYRLGEKFDFDLPGLGTPIVNRPGTAGWSKTTLGTTAYGYGISVTPLHIATFYNAIANKGKMMKPYLVEDIEKDGSVVKKYGPSILNNICSRATADTVTTALKAVTEEGTATRLKDAKLPVAGKTGTAQVVLEAKERGADPYHDRYGRKKNQGTFVGFFPAGDPETYGEPKYTILVTVYSYLSRASFYGGTKPALAVKEIVDNIYAIDGQWGETIRREGEIPVMEAKLVETAPGTVPDLSGMSLRDAMETIEIEGYRCSHEGTGHVKSQTPAPGEKLPAGTVVKIKLK